MEEAGLKTSDSVKVRSTEQVLIREHRLIWPGGPQPRKISDYYESVQNKRQAALCLSGGGIRSAAFALGVLQALSDKKLLTSFQYLSTVSGGGYIGSWLQRWMCEESRRPREDPQLPRPPTPAGAARVMEALGARQEQPQVKRLRENSNFITPRVGIESHDTWTAIAISVRNILVNWLLFLPLLMAVALLPNLFLSGVRSFAHQAGDDPLVLEALLGGAAVAIALAAISTVRLLPSYRGKSRITAHAADRYLFWCIVFPVIVWAALGTLAISVDLLNELPVTKHIKVRELTFSWFDGLDVAIWSFGGMLVGVLLGGLTLKGKHRVTFFGDWAVWPSSVLVVSLWVALGASLFNSFGNGSDPQGPSGLVLTVFGPIWLMSGTLLGAAVFAAFRKSEGPTVKPDGDREWLGRLSAVKIRPMLLWAIVATAVLLLGLLAGPHLDGGELTVSSLLTVIAGYGAVAGGHSEKTRATVGKAKTMIGKYLPRSVMIGIATFVFIIALFFFLGRLEDSLSDFIAKSALKPVLDLVVDERWLSRGVAAHVAMLGVLAVLLLFFRRRIPVNRFSLNGLYRNRLARAFLGAARPARDPDQFTGFDSADNVRMHMLKPRRGPVPLYPIVNIALNITATENLAWQERKAEPFVVSPLFSGSGMLDPEGVASGTHGGAYVESEVYGGSEPDLALGETTGITLATAISISGAAASPNMGYHSSPATAFLMTLFNVRLGAWLPNPARAATLGNNVNRSSPDDSLRALLRELAGQTDDRGLDVYLSDGGHFENLGVYEMIRRRCRYIVVSDAGADPECAFTDLGNAIRKVKIDFDVDIEFPPMRISSRTKTIEGQVAWALGTINYPEPGHDGRILYIKPSFFGDDLPVDVVSYAAEHEKFPHESTGDQFFSESQFESYRRLGEHFTCKLGAKAKGSTLRQFFEGL
jgi:Patatin-like phospholipase